MTKLNVPGHAIHGAMRDPGKALCLMHVYALQSICVGVEWNGI